MELNIKVNPASAEVLDQRRKAMLQVEELGRSQVQWYETKTVGEYRRLRAEGIGFPKPAVCKYARTLFARARDGHPIELRIFDSAKPSKGTLLHFHAGGFVIGSCRSYDNYLAHLSESLSLTVVSVEYRLAPEHPYPTPHYDALDAARFALSNEGESKMGGKLRVLAGESAGAHLAIWVALALRKEHAVEVRGTIAAVIASYGIYDLGYTPSLRHHQRAAVLSREGMMKFAEAAFSTVPVDKRTSPNISPLYAQLEYMPPALFLCGTNDPLVDDSTFMAARWSLAGNQADLCLVPEAWHAFTLVPSGEVTQEGLGMIVSFLERYLDT